MDSVSSAAPSCYFGDWTLEIPRAFLHEPMAAEESRLSLRALLREHALPTPKRRLQAQVAGVIMDLLPEHATHKLVAKRLKMSSRTLQRRLREAGTSLRAIAEATLDDRARLLLQTTDLPAAKIAGLLGYSSPAAFSRAFTRWTSATPGAWRQEHSVAPCSSSTPQTDDGSSSRRGDRESR